MSDRKLPVDTSTGLVTLDCNHQMIYRPAPPSPGETVYCKHCQDYRVVAASEQPIKVRCQQCRYGRSMGVGGEQTLSLSDAKAAAGRHVMKFPDHRVKVTDTDDAVSWISNDGQGELPLAASVSERVAASRVQQSSLRSAFNRSRSALEPRSVDT